MNTYNISVTYICNGMRRGAYLTVFGESIEDIIINNKSILMSDGTTDAWGKRQPIKINLLKDEDEKNDDPFNLDDILDQPTDKVSPPLWEPKCVCGGETAKTTCARWCDKWKAEK